MILETPDLARLAAFGAGVCVIGGGPVGLSTALALSRRGIRVIVLETGGRKATAAAQSLSDAVNASPATHHDPMITTERSLGGASNLWGGRCVPMDPIDFAPRPWLGLPGWPVSEFDIEPYLDEALAILDAGSASFRSPVASVTADPAFTFDTLERWANDQRTQRCNARELETAPSLLVALGTTATGFKYDESGRITAVEVHVEPAERGALPVGSVIIAAGGNETARLLLCEQRRHPRRFGGAGGVLGQGYMAHVTGQIADIAIDDPRLRDAFAFHVDASGRYVRRRFAPSSATQRTAGIANIAFWPSVPRIYDARHHSGPLSAVYLALSIPAVGRRLVADAIRNRHLGDGPVARLPHILNVLREAPRTLSFAPAFLWGTKLSRNRLPGLFLANRAGRYGLEYHSEHLPSAASRVTLTDRLDRIGMPRLSVDLRFSEADAASVVRAHAALDDWLTRNRLGRLDYRTGERDRTRAVLEEALHGAHQIGTVRMGADRASGIVDAECVAYDVPNLAVVSTAVLPTSGQANPTLTAVQLGIRLADRLARGRVDLGASSVGASSMPGPAADRVAA